MRISSVAASASLWLKTIVSDARSSKLIVMYVSLQSRSSLDQVAEVLHADAVDLLDHLGERVGVALAEPVREHRRGDHDQFLAVDLRPVAPPRHQRAADHAQSRMETARVEAPREFDRHRREHQRTVDEVRRIAARSDSISISMLGADRQLDLHRLPLADQRQRDLTVLGELLDQILEPQPKVVRSFTMPTLSISWSPILVIRSHVFSG